MNASAATMFDRGLNDESSKFVKTNLKIDTVLHQNDKKNDSDNYSGNGENDKKDAQTITNNSIVDKIGPGHYNK